MWGRAELGLKYIDAPPIQLITRCALFSVVCRHLPVAPPNSLYGGVR
jgi:hypothetical protein